MRQCSCQFNRALSPVGRDTSTDRCPETEHVNETRFASTRHGQRAGTTLVELLIAGILIGTVMAVTVPTIGVVARERRAAERRVQAMLEVENLMEQITAQSWNDITSESAQRLQISAAASKQLPSATLRCTVDMEEGEPATKQIQIELSWANRTGRDVSPVRLTAWVFRARRPQ